MNFKYEVPTAVGLWTADAPQSSDIVLTPGVVEQVSVTFPAGCAGLVGLRVLRGSFQLWPLTSTGWFIADDHTIVLPDHQVIRNGEDRFRVETYNLDTMHPHTLHIQFAVTIESLIPAEVLQLLEERLPVGLDGLVSLVTEIRTAGGDTIEIMRDELIPILQASLQAQRKLVERSYGDMSIDELLNW